MTKTIQLKAGKTLYIGGYEFPVTEDCSITISGKDITGSYGEKEVANCGGIMVQDYEVDCPAIKKSTLNPLAGYEVGNYKVDGQPVFCIKTSTDIGGHQIFIGDRAEGSDLLSNIQVLAFLHNGFGDGNYTLRFIDGCHFR